MSTRGQLLEVGKQWVDNGKKNFNTNLVIGGKGLIELIPLFGGKLLPDAAGSGLKKKAIEFLGEKGLTKFVDAYLASGTSLELRSGHRISADFDFFTC